MFSKKSSSFPRHLTAAFAIICALTICLAGGLQQQVHAAGNPPSHVLPSTVGGIDFLHGGNASFKHGVTRVKPKTKQGAVGNIVCPPCGCNCNTHAVYGTDPIVFIHGISYNSSITCTGSGGLWSNPISYLQNWHIGLGSDEILWTGQFYTVGYYDQDVRCGSDAQQGALGFQLSTRYNNWAPKCNGYGGTNNNDPTVGTNHEKLEHVSCEFAWFLWNSFSSAGINVKIVAHSMGGLITRYAIQKVQQGDPAFPPLLYVSDVVTFSTPHGALTYDQTKLSDYFCGFCTQSTEMGTGSFMTDITNHDHPSALNGTDWTLIGSLCNCDPLDWQSQATYMSNSGGQSNNHRIGYSSAPACPGQPGWPDGYDHGNWSNDQCDTFDASYWYCDGCSRTQSSFSFSNASPHSLHEMLFAFIYVNW